MSFCIICFLCKLHPSHQVNPGQQHPSPCELIKELEDSRKFSLNSLMTLLAVLALSGSRASQLVVLALLIYTISLRLVVNVCFLQNFPILSRFLHAVPLPGTSCMAGVELVFDMESPALAVVVLLLSILPLVTTVIHHGRRYAESATLVFPIKMRDPAATVSSPANIAVVSNETQWQRQV